MKHIIKSLICVPLLASSLAGALDRPVLETGEQIMALAASPNGGELAFVVKNKNGQALYLRNSKSADSPRLVAKSSVIPGIQFAPDGRLVYAATGSKLWLYTVGRETPEELCPGSAPFAVGGDGKVLFTNDKMIFVLDLADKKVQPVEGAGADYLPCDWLSADSFLACKDGSVWEIGLDGKKQLRVRGNQFDPWYVRARMAPDQSAMLLESDDTRANVGAADRSIWVLDLKDNKAQKLVKGKTACWLDNKRFVTAAGNKLNMVLWADEPKTTTIYQGDLTAFCVAAKEIYFSVNKTDEDGLFAGAAVYCIAVGE